MERTRQRLITALTCCFLYAAVAMAQMGLKVTVNVQEAGTLFVKIQEQIEEKGELSDITELTISGVLNNDDYLVIRNQLENVLLLDLSGLAAECGPTLNVGGKKRVKKIVLPTAATELRDWCIENCDSLTTVVMPPALIAIPRWFVNNCKRLEHIDIPNTVTKIGSSAFCYCHSLKDITLPAGVTEIGDYAFYECKSLSGIVLPKGVRTIGTGTFQNCVALKQISLPTDSLVFKGNAFRNTGFESFTLPEGVILSGDAIFAECPELKSFTFPDGLKDKTEVGTSTFWKSTALETVRLPKDLTEIPDYMFSYTAISSLDIPEGVYRIGKMAFEYCKNITQFNIPASVRELGPNVFEGSGLTSFSWPTAVTTIPNGTFCRCDSLRSVAIPEMVDSIGDGAFYSCISLKRVIFPEGLRTLATDVCSECWELEEVYIPQSVNYISRLAFGKCKKLTSVQIPDGVTYIGWSAFGGVPLTDVKLPSKLKNLAGYAFNGGKYRRVVVPEGCVSMGERCFYSDSLKVVDLPSTLIAIGSYILGDNWYNVTDSVIIRAMVPPYWKSTLFSTGDKKCTLYVPASSVSLYQADDGYNIVSQILPLEGNQSNVLNVAYETHIDTNSGLQQGKYDVNIISLWGRGLETSSDHHPRLFVEEGATFHVGTFNLPHEVDGQYWFTSYKFPTFINRGNTTIDQVDVSCNLRGTTFFTPAFDVRMSDIVPEKPNTPYAIFRYDCGARAAGNFDNTWVRVGADETLLSGQGYAYIGEMTPYKDYKTGKWTKGWTNLHFRSHEGGNSYFAAADDVTLPLKHFAGEFPHNRNWNLIGMPYPAFLDIRGVSYDGPILVYKSDSWDYGWKAWSALDDEQVISPMHAIFIQAPDGVESITFSAARRQPNTTFVKGDAANSRTALRRAEKNLNRTVYNLFLHRSDVPSATEDGAPVKTELDRTRFVINPEATLRYDIGRDAPKMSDEGAVASLYTQANGVAYAINERPLADGIVSLVLSVAEAGTYTLSLLTKSSDEVWLIDNDEHTRTLLSEPYTFTVTNPATFSQRFLIALGNADPASISVIETAQPLSAGGIFNLGGQRLQTPQRGIMIENGKKVIK